LGQADPSILVSQLRAITEKTTTNRYNEALALCQLGRFNAANEILAALFLDIGKVADGLALRICLLYAEIGIRLKRDSVFDLLKHMSIRFQNIFTQSESEYFNFILLRAQAHIQSQEYEEANKYYIILQNIDKQSIDYRVKSIGARILTHDGKYKEAIEIINDNNITYNYIQEHDLGCIHHHMENNHSALWHFSLAQKQHRNITKPNGSPVVMIPKIKREISSSSAYQLLLAGKYVPAFQLFVNELSCEKDSARLWLRTAECVAYHHGTTVAQTRYSFVIIINIL